MKAILLKRDIARHFSNGKFEKILDYLSNGIVWNVVGENMFKGKNAVTDHCIQTAAYFKTVETDFRTTDILISENKVVIHGTAKFKQDGKKLSFVSACDVYEFNDQDKIEKITSYCIPEKIM